MSKDSFYFSHDYNTRSDIKIKRLLLKHGYEGYGIFWAIIEDLYSNANVLQLDYECIAFDMRTSIDKIQSIINDFELFIIENDHFKSLSIERRLIQRNEKSNKAKISAYERWNKVKNNGIDANAMRTHTDSNAIKERKGKESKLNNSMSRTFTRPTLTQVLDFMKELEKVNEPMAERFINYYDSNGWKVGKSSMKDWKAAIRNWLKDTKESKLEVEPVKIKIK